MKKAFTMIELIFVIVILGILAAVALPKFIGVAQQAHEGNLKSFVGTLNRTVGPSWWSTAMPNNGDVSTLNIDSTDALKTYTDVPKEISDFNLSACDDSANYKVIAQGDTGVIGDDTNKYYILCKDGTSNVAPKFMLVKATADLDIGDQNTTAPDSDTNTVEINSETNATIVQQ